MESTGGTTLSRPPVVSMNPESGTHSPRSTAQVGHPQEAESAGRFTAVAAENHELRAQLEQARAERHRLQDMQRRIMELLGTTNPDKLVHDLRNLLNERNLLKALMDET